MYVFVRNTKHFRTDKNMFIIFTFTFILDFISDENYQKSLSNTTRLVQGWPISSLSKGLAIFRESPKTCKNDFNYCLLIVRPRSPG